MCSQKKYKAIVESLGFKLSDNQILEANGRPTAAPGAASTTKAKKTSPAKSTPAKQTKSTPQRKASTKKRVFEDVDSDIDNDDSGTDSSAHSKRARTVQPKVKVERDEINTAVDEDVNADDEIQVVSEGVVAGGFRARSLTIKPDPMTTDDEDNAV